MTQDDILRQAAKKLHERDITQRALRDIDTELRSLCRQYDQIARCWGFQPHHLANECRNRGIVA